MKPDDIPPSPALERHYSPKEIAEMWGIHVTTVRRLFQDEPGVLKLTHLPLGSARPRVTLRIPESVLQRVHNRRSRGFQLIQPGDHETR